DRNSADAGLPSSPPDAPPAWGSHARNSRDRAPGPLTARGDRLRCSRIPGSNYGTGLTHQAKTDLYAGDAGAVYSTVSSRCRSAKPVGNYGEASLAPQGSRLVAKTPQSEHIPNKISRDVLVGREFCANLSLAA